MPVTTLAPFAVPRTQIIAARWDITQEMQVKNNTFISCFGAGLAYHARFDLDPEFDSLTVTALNGSTGEMKWTQPCPSACKPNMQLFYAESLSALILVCDTNDPITQTPVFAYDAQSGVPIMNVTLPWFGSTTTIVCTTGDTVITRSGSILGAVNSTTGRVLWTNDAGVPIAAAICVTGDNSDQASTIVVSLANVDGEVLSFATTTGVRGNWTLYSKSLAKTAPIAVYNTTCFLMLGAINNPAQVSLVWAASGALSVLGSLRAAGVSMSMETNSLTVLGLTNHSVETVTGPIRWQTNLSGVFGTVKASVTAFQSPGTLLVPCESALVALNTSDGEILWNVSVSANVSTASTVFGAVAGPGCTPPSRPQQYVAVYKNMLVHFQDTGALIGAQDIGLVGVSSLGVAPGEAGDGSCLAVVQFSSALEDDFMNERFLAFAVPQYTIGGVALEVPDYSQDTAYTSVALSWQDPFVVVSGAERVGAIAAETGEVLWEAIMPDIPAQLVRVGPSAVVVVLNLHYLILDASSGRPLSTLLEYPRCRSNHPQSDSFDAYAATLQNDVVYVASSPCILALQVETPLSKAIDIGALGGKFGPLLLTSDHLFIAYMFYQSTYIVAIDVHTNDVLWENAVNPVSSDSDHHIASLVNVRGILYVSCGDNGLAAIDIATGQLLWEIDAAVGFNLLRVSNDNTILTDGAANQILAINLELEVEERVSIFFPGTVLHQEVSARDMIVDLQRGVILTACTAVYDESSEALVTAVELASGKLMWSWNVSHKLQEDPLLQSGDIVLIRAGSFVYARQMMSGNQLFSFHMRNYSASNYLYLVDSGRLLLHYAVYLEGDNAALLSFVRLNGTAQTLPTPLPPSPPQAIPPGYTPELPPLNPLPDLAALQLNLSTAITTSFVRQPMSADVVHSVAGFGYAAVVVLSPGLDQQYESYSVVAYRAATATTNTTNTYLVPVWNVTVDSTNGGSLAGIAVIGPDELAIVFGANSMTLDVWSISKRQKLYAASFEWYAEETPFLVRGDPPVVWWGSVTCFALFDYGVRCFVSTTGTVVFEDSCADNDNGGLPTLRLTKEFVAIASCPSYGFALNLSAMEDTSSGGSKVLLWRTNASKQSSPEGCPPTVIVDGVGGFRCQALQESRYAIQRFSLDTGEVIAKYVVASTEPITDLATDGVHIVLVSKNVTCLDSTGLTQWTLDYGSSGIEGAAMIDAASNSVWICNNQYFSLQEVSLADGQVLRNISTGIDLGLSSAFWYREPLLPGVYSLWISRALYFVNTSSGRVFKDPSNIVESSTSAPFTVHSQPPCFLATTALGATCVMALESQWSASTDFFSESPSNVRLNPTRTMVFYIQSGENHDGFAESAVVALDFVSGKPLWAHRSPPDEAFTDLQPVGSQYLVMLLAHVRIVLLEQQTGTVVAQMLLPMCQTKESSVVPYSDAKTMLTATGTLAFVAEFGQTPCVTTLNVATKRFSNVSLNAPVNSFVVTTDTVVVVVDTLGALYGLDAATGNLLWTIQTDIVTEAVTGVATSTYMYVAASNQLRCFELNTGVLAWREEAVGSDSPPVLYGNSIFAALNDGTVAEFTLTQTLLPDTSRKQWSAQLLAKVSHSTNPLTPSKPRMQVTASGYLIALQSYGVTVFDLNSYPHRAAWTVKLSTTDCTPSIEFLLVENMLITKTCMISEVYSVASGERLLLIPLISSASGFSGPSTLPGVIVGTHILYDTLSGAGGYNHLLSLELSMFNPQLPAAQTLPPPSETLAPGFSLPPLFTPAPTLPEGVTWPDLGCRVSVEGAYPRLLWCVQKTVDRAQATRVGSTTNCTMVATMLKDCTGAYLNSLSRYCEGGVLLLSEVLVVLNRSVAFDFCGKAATCAGTGGSTPAETAALVCDALKIPGWYGVYVGQTLNPAVTFPAPANKVPEEFTVGPQTTEEPLTLPPPASTVAPTTPTPHTRAPSNGPTTPSTPQTPSPSNPSKPTSRPLGVGAIVGIALAGALVVAAAAGTIIQRRRSARTAALLGSRRDEFSSLRSLDSLYSYSATDGV